MKTLIFILIFSSALHSFGQQARIGDSVEISFLHFEHDLTDSSQLYMRIVLKNISIRPIFVYKDLIFGYPQERFANLDLLLQKRENGIYVHQSTGYYKISDEYLYNRAYRHYDPPKIRLAPFSEDTLLFGLGYLRLIYDTGNYRIKLNLRINTVLNTAYYEPDSSTLYDPPADKIEYVASGWIYFRVARQIALTP